MGRHSVPDRWLDYKAVGSQVNGTNFIAFKVPLNDQLNGSVNANEQFNGKKLLEKVPNLGLIIDLTNTNRYYNPHEFQEKGIQYAKVMVPGHEVPKTDIRKSFSTLVKTYLEDERNSNKLIGVHCTHGINRTGFLICFFMIQELNIDPLDAIKRFEIARGYAIERTNYINFLKSFKNSCNEKVIEKKYNLNTILDNSNADRTDLKNFKVFEEVSQPNNDKAFESSYQKNNSHWDVIPGYSFADRLKCNLNANNTNSQDTNNSQNRDTNTIPDMMLTSPHHREINATKRSYLTRRSKSPTPKTFSSRTTNTSDKTFWRESRVRDPYFQNNSPGSTTMRWPSLNYNSQEKSINDHGSWKETGKEKTRVSRIHIVTRSKSPSSYSYNSRERSSNDLRNNQEPRPRNTFQNYERHSYQSNNHNDSDRFYSNHTLPYVHSQHPQGDPYPTSSQQYLNNYGNTSHKSNYSYKRSRNNNFKFD